MYTKNTKTQTNKLHQNTTIQNTLQYNNKCTTQKHDAQHTYKYTHNTAISRNNKS